MSNESENRKNIVIVNLDNLNYCPKCGSDGDEHFMSDLIRIKCDQCGLEM